jgi:hypothetical protein
MHGSDATHQLETEANNKKERRRHRSRNRRTDPAEEVARFSLKTTTDKTLAEGVWARTKNQARVRERGGEEERERESCCGAFTREFLSM